MSLLPAHVGREASLTVVVAVPRDIARVVVGENDELGDNQYDERSDTQEVDDQAKPDEEPGTGSFAQPRVCHDGDGSEVIQT